MSAYATEYAKLDSSFAEQMRAFGLDDSVGGDEHYYLDREGVMRERGDSGVGARRYFVEHTDDGIKLVPEREFAVNAFPTYPGGGPQVTVDTALRTPNIIARALTDLAYLRFVADRVLARGSAEQVAGGAAVFQRAEGLFPDRVSEIVGVRSEWPRSAWTVPDLFGSPVQALGLETPIHDLTARRNAIDELARAQRKLANAVVKQVDGLAMTMITTDPAVSTFTAASTWTGGTPNIIGDLVAARNLIVNADLGYEADTLIINPAQEGAMLGSSTVANYLPRESTPRNAVVTGNAVPILGLRQILVSNQIAAGKGIMLNSGVVGSIAEEPPRAQEGYTTYDPGAGQPAIQVKTYRIDRVDETIVRGARFPAMWIAEPKAAVYMQGL